jgi:hypothetical protein
MGEETREFASQFSSALRDLDLLASDATYEAFAREHGARLEARVRDALDAVASVYETDTPALEDWRTERARVLARIALVREALDRSGMDGEARRSVAGLLAEMGAGRRRRGGRRHARSPSE